MLSVVIPAYKEPYLQKMIDDILAKSEAEIEVIPVLDGYWANPPLKEDPRMKIVHLGKQSGMREAINKGVSVAKGEYIMRGDGHCIFGQGFDKIITETFEDNWIVTPRRYFLDPVKWQVMDLPYVDYEKLKIINYGRGQKFAGVPWETRKRRRAHIKIDETMAMQGSCWIMKKKWWEKVIVDLDSKGYGTHYQDSHEMQFKTWKAGGKLMVNKNTWFAHKHRQFPRSHGYGGKLADNSFAYTLSQWRDYYEEKIKPKWGI